MMTLIIGGIVVLIGASLIFFSQKKEGDEDEVSSAVPEVSEAKSWDMPVLDGTEEVNQESGPDMSKFPGWSSEQVQKYLDSGWSEEQLAEWYKQQVDSNITQD